MTFIKTSKQCPHFSNRIDLEDLDLDDNHGLDHNEKDMLRDLIKNGSHIISCEFNHEGHVEFIRMQFGEKFSDSVLFPELFRLYISYDTPIGVEFVKKHGKSIKWLGLSGKELIKNPDLSKLVNLRELYLSNNNIEQITGCGALPELSYLNLSNNQIKSLKGLEEFADCPKLSKINLSKNQIIDLCEFEPISHLRNLERINLSRNKITEVNITHDVPKLSFLFLNENQIGKIVAIKKLSGLVWINLLNNQLVKLENISNLPKLSSIDVDGHPLNSFSGMENLPNLQEISCIAEEEYDYLRSREELEGWEHYFKDLGFKFYWTDSGLVIDKIRFPTLTYRINEHLSLKLKRDKSEGTEQRFMIYVDGIPFRSCVCLLITVEIDKINSLDSINSIDELDKYDERKSDYYNSIGEIPAEERVWGHCSNIQAWVEHDHDTRLLYRSLAFPLLKRMTEAGDLTAKIVFKEELAKRYSSGHPSVHEYLKKEG